MHKISIIIPYFKKKFFFKKTILSILNQTLKSFEVIIIYDDEDKSDLNFIKKLIKKDKRFRLIINKKNLGAGESRNIGIDVAKGKYICFIDADDIWMKRKLELQIKFMINRDISFSHSSYEIIDDSDKVKGCRIAENYDNYMDLCKSCNIGLSTVIIERKLLSNKLRFPQLKTKEDFVLWLLILKRGNKIFGFKKNLVKWRKSENSLSSSSIQKIKDGFRVYNKYLGFNYLKSYYYLTILSLNYIKKNLLN